MAKITFTLAYEKLRKIIAKLTGRRQEDILAGNPLSDFGFNEVGFERLLGSLKEEFALFNIDLTLKDIVASTTVNDLFQTIWSKIPNSIKEVTTFAEHILANLDLLHALSEELSKTSEAKRIEREIKIQGNESI